MNVLTCSRVAAAYRGDPVFRDVDIELDRGAWLTLIGRNGVGKTTLLRAIAGLVPFDGEIRVCGGPGETMTNVTSLNVRERALAMAYVPQRPTVPVGMIVRDYVLLGRAAHIPLFGVERSNDISIVVDVMNRLDIASFEKRRVEELSGGEWQRVVLARALAQQPQLLLLDEPTTSLDIGHQQDALELIDQLRLDGGLSVLSTMHELTMAGQYSDRIALLGSDGIVAHGSAAEVLTTELISTHYGADVEVHHAEGTVTMVPIRRPHQA